MGVERLQTKIILFPGTWPFPQMPLSDTCSNRQRHHKQMILWTHSNRLNDTRHQPGAAEKMNKESLSPSRLGQQQHHRFQRTQTGMEKRSESEASDMRGGDACQSICSDMVAVFQLWWNCVPRGTLPSAICLETRRLLGCVQWQTDWTSNKSFFCERKSLGLLQRFSSAIEELIIPHVNLKPRNQSLNTTVHNL